MKTLMIEETGLWCKPGSPVRRMEDAELSRYQANRVETDPDNAEGSQDKWVWVQVHKDYRTEEADGWAYEGQVYVPESWLEEEK